MEHYEKFASDDKHNSMTLTADGCMARRDDPTPFRDLEINTRVDSFGKGAEADENILMNYVSILAKCGKQPSRSETIEHFVIKNIALIDDYQNPNQ